MCHRTLRAGPGVHARPAAARTARPRSGRSKVVVCSAPVVPVTTTTSTATSSTDTQKELGWRTDLRQSYVLGPQLGVGSFGSVNKAFHAESGQQVAVKTLPKERPKLSRAKVLEKLQRELTLLDRLSDSPRVVQLMECFEDEDHVYIVTEACEGGDLQRFSDTYGPLTERCLALVALEVLQIVRSCHRLGIVHGDVKPANFCIKDEHRHPYAASPAALQRAPWLKAIDFGCSQLHYRHTRLSKRSGTPVYMAPEIFKRDYSFEVDVWSTGVLLYQLYCRHFPFWAGDSYNRALSLDEVAKAITENAIRMDFGPWLVMSPEGLDFVRGCLTRDPAQRLTVDEALEHPWLQKFAGDCMGSGLAGPLVESAEAQAGGVVVANNIVRSPSNGGAPAQQQQQPQAQGQQQQQDAAMAA
ncbi:hypothetical protein HYH02_011395 [Chlamydomonas schloesseri]|uniref:Protein kinase domain-containing protein n=1 Tax=Chlamydomonas schloesseri TaxID=2026947 RepID=A0A835T1J1_9CHLO|nr:hypothetical protein HYH02_011395 [Chlamydomonas schloesseri]|eukprot:KAG2437139.1 hypothetical protein HYH02_011395 [Chlamydomonas schloesseri]